MCDLDCCKSRRYRNVAWFLCFVNSLCFSNFVLICDYSPSFNHHGRGFDRLEFELWSRLGKNGNARFECQHMRSTIENRILPPECGQIVPCPEADLFFFLWKQLKLGETIFPKHALTSIRLYWYWYWLIDINGGLTKAVEWGK